MRIVKGKVVGNTVVLDDSLPEGSDVEVVLREAGDDDFVLTAQMEQELLEASEAARRGEVVDMDDVLEELEAIG